MILIREEMHNPEIWLHLEIIAGKWEARKVKDRSETKERREITEKRIRDKISKDVDIYK